MSDTRCTLVTYCACPCPCPCPCPHLQPPLQPCLSGFPMIDLHLHTRPSSPIFHTISHSAHKELVHYGYWNSGRSSESNVASCHDKQHGLKDFSQPSVAAAPTSKEVAKQITWMGWLAREQGHFTPSAGSKEDKQRMRCMVYAVPSYAAAALAYID